MVTDVLVKRFVKNSEDVENPAVRGAYGTLSSVVGILCNILLFVLKYVMGTLSGSIAIVSDGFNNLSDAASCFVTLFGYRLAAKPADRDHPFGHGRVEHLTSMIIAVVILMVGWELLRDSFDKILHPTEVAFRWVVLASLLLSIALKLWMSLFNTKLGKKIKSGTMLATAQDSRNDVIATTATVISLVVSGISGLNIDGYMGVLVSLFILKAGYEIIKDTVDELLGKPADPELVRQIEAIVCRDERILGIHDMAIHSYGPGNQFGSLHAEVRSTEDIMSIHDLIDCIEHEVLTTLNVNMTIHMDPLEVDNEQVCACRDMVYDLLKAMDPQLRMHDFRMVSGETHTNLIFDVVIPYQSEWEPKRIEERLAEELSKQPVLYLTVITFDRDLVGGK